MWDALTAVSTPTEILLATRVLASLLTVKLWVLVNVIPHSTTTSPRENASAYQTSTQTTTTTSNSQMGPSSAKVALPAVHAI